MKPTARFLNFCMMYKWPDINGLILRTRSFFRPKRNVDAIVRNYRCVYYHRLTSNALKIMEITPHIVQK